jgi:DNA-binding transcriptional MerR regulator
MNQRKFRIGELSDKLDVKKFVIRFWEKEFGLKSDRSGGGQRFYTQEDFDRFAYIKELLYEQKFTIPGAKNQLKNIKEITPAIKEDFTYIEKQNTPISEINTNPEIKNLFTELKTLKYLLENLYKTL